MLPSKAAGMSLLHLNHLKFEYPIKYFWGAIPTQLKYSVL